MTARWFEAYDGDYYERMRKVRRTPAYVFFGGLGQSLGVLKQVGFLLGGGEEEDKGVPMTPGSAIRVTPTKVKRD